MSIPAQVTLHLPDWTTTLVDWQKSYPSDTEKMALAIELSRQNCLYQTGGPFGCAIFEQHSGRLLSVGVNRVLPLHNPAAHGEIMAIMLATQHLKQFSLSANNLQYELFSSCEPCAMCLGGVLWSGVKRLVCAATADDARAVGFDEGPVNEHSYQYLQQAGIEIVRNLQRQQAREVLQHYAANGGVIYNG